jgi:hypothetical protein
MGWLWGSSESNDSNKSQDPLRDLNPELRNFLEKESPVKYSSSNPPAAARPVHAHAHVQEQAQTPKDIAKAENSSVSPPQDSRKVPPESLFQDGRYAHIWKHYKPLHEIENETKSDQEKIMDVIEGYKDRKAEIGRAALENCALEQWEINECFKKGGFTSRMTMCRTENREFERCYMMQSVCHTSSKSFYSAMGYAYETF